MIPQHLLPLTVTWQQPGVDEDEYGNLLADWSDAARTDNDIAAYIEQRATTELVDGRDVTVTRLLFVTNELGVQATHRIVWEGTPYEVDGDAFVFQTPAGPHHLEASLLLVDGVNPEGGS